MFDRIDRLSAVADSAGVSLVALALGALLASPVVPCVIVGATSPE